MEVCYGKVLAVRAHLPIVAFNMLDLESHLLIKTTVDHPLSSQIHNIEL